MTLANDEKFKMIWQKILVSKNILLVSHIDPDVDAISSLGAMMELIKDLDKNYLAFAQGKKQDQYFLPNEDEIISDRHELFQIAAQRFNNGKELKHDFLSVFDLVIVLDCGSIERTFLDEYIQNIRYLMLDTFVIEIDHHVPDRTYADIEIKEPLASTTEILFHFMKANNLPLTRNIANCLLAGLLTDTANFLYPSVSSSTMKVASELMSQGAQFPKLLNNTWRNKNFSEMKLWGLALDNLRVNPKYNIAYSVLPFSDLKKFKQEFGFWGPEAFSDIVGFLSNLSEASIVMLLREEKEGLIKASLRVGVSDERADVNRIARFFGGGGHVKASGFALRGYIVKKGNGFAIV